MAKDPKSSSPPLPSTNSNNKETKIHRVLPFFGFINITIAGGTTIYRAHGNGDIPMMIFITFAYFGTLLLDCCFKLYHSLPRFEKSARKHKLKNGIWVLLSSIMFGFACQFSTFMSHVESLAFFALVIAGNSLLFYMYFIWSGNEHKSCDDGEICSNSQHPVSIRIPMANDPETSSSPLPASKTFCVLLFFGFMNITITSSTAIYRSHNNGDIPMVLFITFIYFGTILLDYWFRLYNNPPGLEELARRRKLKIGIWVFLSSIMFGFACEFLILMRPGESRAISAVVIGGSSLLFYVYFICRGIEDKRCEIWSNSNREGQNRVAHTSRNEEEVENRALMETLDIV